MPEFPGQVRHSNQAFPVLDLTDGTNQFNQTGKSPVKGMGVFTDIPSRSAITSRYRTKGYLAVVGSTPFVYTSGSTSDGDWATEGNWSGLSATNGLPSGGVEHNALVKLSDSDYDAGWTGDPEFSTLNLKKQAPQLNFVGTQDSDSSTMGRIQVNSGSKAGPKIDFTQVGASGASGVAGKIDFFTSTTSGAQEKAFTLNEEKTAIFASHSSAPTPHAGGFYYNKSQDSYFVGVEN